MANGLVGINMTRLNVETVLASVKQQHYKACLQAWNRGI